jgi:hypothetical protein
MWSMRGTAGENGERPRRFQSRGGRLEAGAEIAKVSEEVEHPVGEVDQASPEFNALAGDSQHRRDQDE